MSYTSDANVFPGLAAPIAVLLAANEQVLQQGAELLERLTDEQYTLTARPLFAYGVGSHFRHCLDFYTSFLAGVLKGCVDYDRRERDERLAQDRTYARAHCDWLRVTLPEILREAPAMLRVRQDGPSWADSSVVRELQVLLSHTVHHYALMALILRLQGYEPGAEFGVAPATLEYWQGSVGGRR